MLINDVPDDEVTFSLFFTLIRGCLKSAAPGKD